MRKYEDAKKCFINAVSCSPEIRKKKPLIVKGEPQGWALAEMLGAAVALAKQEKPKVKPTEELIKLAKAGEEFEKAMEKVQIRMAEENPFYVWLLAIVVDLPPLEYCVQNFEQVLKSLEPKEIATVSLFGQKH